MKEYYLLTPATYQMIALVGYAADCEVCFSLIDNLPN